MALKHGIGLNPNWTELVKDWRKAALILSEERLELKKTAQRIAKDRQRALSRLAHRDLRGFAEHNREQHTIAQVLREYSNREASRLKERPPPRGHGAGGRSAWTNQLLAKQIKAGLEVDRLVKEIIARLKRDLSEEEMHKLTATIRNLDTETIRKYL